MMLGLVLLLSSPWLSISGSSPVSPRRQMIGGLLEGFTSEQPDLADCIGDVDADLKIFEDAVNDILKRDLPSVAAGLRKLADALDALPTAKAECRATKDDWKQIRTTLSKIRSVKDLGAHIWSDVISHSKDILSELSSAAAAHQALDYVEVGRRIGVVFRLVIVGKAARMPLPPPPQPPFNRGMKVRSPDEMVRAEPGDQIDVDWNLTPVMIENLSSWGGALGVFHVSIGFTNRRTGLNSTVEFAADNFDATLVIPFLHEGDRTISWGNTGQVLPKEGEFDANYWQYRTRLATINGITYNEMLSWLVFAKNQFQRYDLFYLDTATHKQPLDGYFKGFTCFDFAYKAIEHLVKLAGPCVLDRSLPGLLRNDMVLWAKEVEADAPTPDDVFEFYEAVRKIPDLWSLNASKTIAEVSRLVETRRNGHAVYHESITGKYWFYTPSRPFLGMRKRFDPLPGKCEPPQAVLV